MLEDITGPRSNTPFAGRSKERAHKAGNMALV
jgi:hypothetical protein